VRDEEEDDERDHEQASGEIGEPDGRRTPEAFTIDTATTSAAPIR